MIPTSPYYLQYFEIGGLTIQVQTPFPLSASTFKPTFEPFRVTGPGSDTIQIRHHIGLPDLSWLDRSKPVYHQAPWEIHHTGTDWIYLGIPVDLDNPAIHFVAIFIQDYSNADIFHPDDRIFRVGNLSSLTLMPTDQILLAQVLAGRQACYMHASGFVLNGCGLAFVGHSEAGKSTVSQMLQGEGEILCDDRIIVRRWADGFRVHGTWSHGDIPQVSAGSAPLRAVFLLEQAPENRLIRLEVADAVRALPEFVIRPLVTRDWWERVLETLGRLAREVPVYRLRLDKSGAFKPLLRALLDKLDG